MVQRTVTQRILTIQPRHAVPGGRVTLEGGPFPTADGGPPVVRVAGLVAHVSFAAPDTIRFHVPRDVPSGRQPVRVDQVPGETVFLDIAETVTRGVHAVDNPAIGPDGSIYVTCSGSRGQQMPVSVYRCTPDGRREIHVTGITNATSLAFDREGTLHVSSRFDGTVSRIEADGRAVVVASELGVASGLAFLDDGTMLVGDRSGTVFRMRPGGDPEPWASLPPSVAAFHLAVAPDGVTVYATAPTLAPVDAVYRIDADGTATVVNRSFGRPQGLAFDGRGRLHVVEALAGVSGVYRLDPLDGGAVVTPVVAAASLVGLAFDREGGLVLASNDAVYRFPVFDV